MLEEAHIQSPEGHLEGLFFGTGPSSILTIYMAYAYLGDYTNTDFLYFDQKTGRHLFTWRRGQNQTLGDWLLWLLVPLHFGTPWGLAGNIARCSLGMVLPLVRANSGESSTRRTADAGCGLQHRADDVSAHHPAEQGIGQPGDGPGSLGSGTVFTKG